MEADRCQATGEGIARINSLGLSEGCCSECY